MEEERRYVTCVHPQVAYGVGCVSGLVIAAAIFMFPDTPMAGVFTATAMALVGAALGARSKVMEVEEDK